MGERLELVTPLHRRSRREYLPRMLDDKVHCMRVAKRYGADYWDGDRRYGYGGYRYDGRWAPVAAALIERYGLTAQSRVLDVGCGKGYLLHELGAALPGITLVGLDISEHALSEAHPAVRHCLSLGDAAQPLPFADDEFDLAVSLGALHNLRLPELHRALGELARVARDGYVLVESFRDEQELFNLQCWALTCETFLTPESWEWLYEQAGYRGDREFIYFE